MENSNRWLKIGFDGTFRYVDLPDSFHDSDNPFLEACYRELNCDSIEIVRCSPAANEVFCGGFECVLIIDECGKLKEGFEDRINNVCTLLFAPGFDIIVGDALLGMRIGADVVPLPIRYYVGFVKAVTDFFEEWRKI